MRSHSGGRFRKHLTIWLVAVGAAWLSGCASNVRVLDVKQIADDYKVKEVVVTGQPVLDENDYYPILRIAGYDKPDGSKFYLYSRIHEKELQSKLDPKKTYQFHLFVSEQKRSGQETILHAFLSKVEENGQILVDASVCGMHGVKMEFVPAENAYWHLSSAKEERDLEKYRNHGYTFPSCCSGGLIRWHTWRCPECARKVDAFQSKYDP